MSKNIVVRQLLFLLVGIVIFGLSFCFIYKSMNSYTQDTVTYQEDNSVDYKVYLKENDFFETPYLEKNQIYITSLIDYIDVDFKYKLNLENKVSGKYKYYIKGIISANRLNTEDSSYWQKEYDLTPVKEVNYEETKEILFDENIKVNYQYYNDILLEFKKTYNLSLDGTLKIVLFVENDISGIDQDDKIKKVSMSLLTIPLTKATIEVPIKIETVNETGMLKSQINYNETEALIYRVLAILSIILAVIDFIYLGLKFTRYKKRQSVYKKKLKKILKTYDSVIVNLKGDIATENLNIVDVSEFNELIDAHSEVRQPINFVEKKNQAVFILINDKMAWRYILKKY